MTGEHRRKRGKPLEAQQGNNKVMPHMASSPESNLITLVESEFFNTALTCLSDIHLLWKNINC